MATKAEKTAPEANPADTAWTGPKLIGLGAVALLCALTIIIWMGSRYEGCVYVDGSQPGHAIGR